MRRVLAAPAAELFQFQTVRCRFAVLGLRIVPLFAITALQRNNFSGHCSQLLTRVARAPSPAQRSHMLHATRARAPAPHRPLRHNLRDRARADRVPAFANRKP